MAVFFQKISEKNYYNELGTGSSGGEFLFPGDYLYKQIVAYYCVYLSINNTTADNNIITCGTPYASPITVGDILIFKTNQNLNTLQFNKGDYVSVLLVANLPVTMNSTTIGDFEIIDINGNEFIIKALNLRMAGQMGAVWGESNVKGLFMAKGHVKLQLTTDPALQDTDIYRNYIQVNIYASLITDNELNNYNDKLTQQIRNINLQNNLYNNFTIPNNAINKATTQFTQSSKLGFEIYANNYNPANVYNHLAVQLWNFQIPDANIQDELRLYIAPIRITVGLPFYHFLRNDKNDTINEINNNLKDANIYGTIGLKLPVKFELINNLGYSESYEIDPDAGISNILGSQIKTVPSSAQSLQITGYTGEATIQPAFNQLNTNINQLKLQLTNIPIDFTTSGKWTLNIMQITSASNLPQVGNNYVDSYLGSIVNELINGNTGIYYNFNPTTNELTINYLSNYFDADYLLISLSYKDAFNGAINKYILIPTTYQTINAGDDIDVYLEKEPINTALCYPMRGGLQWIILDLATTSQAPITPFDRHQALIYEVYLNNCLKAGNIEINLKEYKLFDYNLWTIDPINIFNSYVNNKYFSYNNNWQLLNLISGLATGNVYLLTLTSFIFYPFQIQLNNPYDKNYNTKLDWLDIYNKLKPLGFNTFYKIKTIYKDLNDNVIKQQIDYKQYLPNDNTSPYDFNQQLIGTCGTLDVINNIFSLSKNVIKINEKIAIELSYKYDNVNFDCSYIFILNLLIGKENNLNFSNHTTITSTVITHNKIEDLGAINLINFSIDTTNKIINARYEFIPNETGDYNVFANLYFIQGTPPSFAQTQSGIDARKLQFKVVNDYQLQINEIQPLCDTPLFITSNYLFNFLIIDQLQTYTATYELCDTGAVNNILVNYLQGLAYGSVNIANCMKITYLDNGTPQANISPPVLKPVSVNELPDNYFILEFYLKGQVINAGIDTQSNELPATLIGFGEIVDHSLNFENELYLTERWSNELISKELQESITIKFVITHGWQLYNLTLMRFCKHLELTYFNKLHPLHNKKIRGIIENIEVNYENNYLTANISLLIDKIYKIRSV